MKPSISSSGVSISGSVGGQKGTVGVGSNGTVSLGIDTAGIKLGITNDYGGAGTIGFGGQSITLGTEGGNIKLGIGGFEVFVEARNCIVIETKKIAGMIVSQRSYPDPGCKQPMEPTQQKPSGLKLGYPKDKIPNLDPNCLYDFLILIVGRKIEKRGLYKSTGQNSYDTWNKIEYTYGDYSTHIAGINPYNPKTGRYSLKINGQGVLTPGNGAMLYIYREFPGDDYKNYYEKTESFQEYGGIFSPARFKAHINNTFLNPQSLYFIGPGTMTIVHVPISCSGIPSPLYSPPSLILLLSPSAGNRPPMPESCCESLKADIEDIKQVLATKEMLAGKLTFPWRLRMPGGEGEEIVLDYPNLARCLAQMIDHLGIHPPKLSIKDINNAVAGNQSIENQFPSGTQAFEALMAQVWDANADVDTLTNFLYRLSWLCVQQSMNLARVSGDIQCIKDMFGGETEPQESSITTPFNIGAGVEEKPAPTKGKGFGKSPGGNIDKSIEANTELSTEKLLPDFLKIRENPVIVQTFTGNKDVFDLLSIIILKLEGLQNR